MPNFCKQDYAKKIKAYIYCFTEEVPEETIGHLKGCEVCLQALKSEYEEQKIYEMKHPFGRYIHIEWLLEFDKNGEIDEKVHRTLTHGIEWGEGTKCTSYEEYRLKIKKQAKKLAAKAKTSVTTTKVLSEKQPSTQSHLKRTKIVEIDIFKEQHGFSAIFTDGKETYPLSLKVAGNAQEIPKEIPIPPTFLDGYSVFLKFDRHPHSGSLKLRLEGAPPYIYALLTIKILYSDGRFQVILGENASNFGIDIDEGNTSYVIGAEVIYKYLFSIDIKYQEELDNVYIPEELRNAFERLKIQLPPNTIIEIRKENEEWLIIDKDNERKFSIIKFKNTLQVYKE